MATTQSSVPNGSYEKGAAPEAAASNTETQVISADEIALYDRQIRLWGVKAQEKIRNANILLVTIKALGNEVAKNLVLAGIGSLTIIDHESVTEDDLASQFLISEADVGMNRATAASPQLLKLNPRVSLHVDATDFRLKPSSYFQSYDVIIATDLDFDVFTLINSSCRFANKPFYAAASHGFYGYIFADLISHEFVIERQKSNVPTELKAETSTRSIISSSVKKENGTVIEMITKQELYSPLAEANRGPLPPDTIANKRRLRQIPPVLTGIKALWEFQQLSGGSMPSHSKADLELFTTLATSKHRELGLPTETLTSHFLRTFLQDLGCELAPVTAVLGGQLAQDVINVLGQREQPIQNFLVFDGEESKGPIYALHPIGPVDGIQPDNSFL